MVKSEFVARPQFLQYLGQLLRFQDSWPGKRSRKVELNKYMQLCDRGNYTTGATIRQGQLYDRDNYATGATMGQGQLFDRGNYMTGAKIMRINSKYNIQ